MEDVIPGVKDLIGERPPLKLLDCHVECKLCMGNRMYTYGHHTSPSHARAVQTMRDAKVRTTSFHEASRAKPGARQIPTAERVLRYLARWLASGLPRRVRPRRERPSF